MDNVRKLEKIKEMLEKREKDIYKYLDSPIIINSDPTINEFFEKHAGEDWKKEVWIKICGERAQMKNELEFINGLLCLIY